jgi:hypothetical protein
MTLKKTKLLFILLLTVMLSVLSCSIEDDEIAEAVSDDNSVHSKYCINLPGELNLTMGLDSLSQDTLKIFPLENNFHEIFMKGVMTAQGMVSTIVNELDATVSGKTGVSWMSYEEPYLGVYSSLSDSRFKQWNLEKTKVGSDILTEEGTEQLWDNVLSISDMPKGTSTSGDVEISDKALELYYKDNFSNGVMLFSPTDFDAVNFPVKIFGDEIMGKFVFDDNYNIINNKLFITGIGEKNNVKYIRNIYLRLERYNNLIAVMTMIDLPSLWFSDKHDKDNVGYTVSAVGAIDATDGMSVMYIGFVPNTSSDVSVAKLITDNPAGKVLAKKYAEWRKMAEDAELDISASDFDDYDKKTYGSLFDIPAYFNSGVFIKTGGEMSGMEKVIERCKVMLGGEFPLSPRELAAYKVDWNDTDTEM